MSTIWNTFASTLAKKGWRAYANFLISLYERNHKKTKLFSKPYVMYLDSVSYCNLQCPFCPTGTKTSDRQKATLSLDKFKHILDHIGPYLFELKLYNWAEPLLNKDLPEMIRYAKKYHIPISLSTNLSIPLTEQKIGEIVSSGLNVMICSIDGASQESYQKYRIGGDYNLVIKNIEMINKIKKEKNSQIPILIWQFLVFKHNEHEIEKAKQKATELGMEIIVELPYVPQNEIKEWGSTLPQFSPTLNSNSTLQIDSPSQNSLIPNKPCTWLWSTIVINPTGSISPCCVIANEKDDFGSVDDSIRKVWNNKKYQGARQLFKNGKKTENVICNRCPNPSIQQNILLHDEQILRHLFDKTSAFVLIRVFVEQILKICDKESYLKYLEFKKIQK